MKIHEIFLESANFFILFYTVFKEQMFAIETEDGCEAPCKPSILKI